MRAGTLKVRPKLPDVHSRIAQYYAAKLREHGATPRGVDWNSEQAQLIRFEQVLKIVQGGGAFTLNDFGCGYGALADTLAASGAQLTYCGFDLAPEMIETARHLHPGSAHCTFTSGFDEVPVADYSVASGIFSVKMDVPPEDWEAYVEQTLERMHARSRKGFAFNLLTAYSDEDRKRRDLYYADPHRYFDYCRRHFSRNVALLHDYGLYEFTLHVRML